MTDWNLAVYNGDHAVNKMIVILVSHNMLSADSHISAQLTASVRFKMSNLLFLRDSVLAVVFCRHTMTGLIIHSSIDTN